MVEQRPFKALVVGSSPTQPIPVLGLSERNAMFAYLPE